MILKIIKPKPMWIVQLFFPYAISVVVFIAVARFFLIYEKFNCHIFNYLELSDLTVNIAHDLYGLTWFLFPSIIAFLAKDLLRQTSWGCNVFFASLAAILAIGFIYVYRTDRITSFKSHFVASWLVYGSLSLFGFCIVRWCPAIDRQLLMIGMILSFSWLYSKSLCQFTVHELKEQHISKGTTILFKENPDRIVSDENLYYIGNTSKYAFVYNSQTHSASTYPMSNILSIENSQPVRSKGLFEKSKNEH